MRRSTIILLVLELSLLIAPGWAQQFSVPLRFEPNTRQVGAAVSYIARGSAYTALLDETGLAIGPSANPIRMRFVGASRPMIQPFEEMNIHTNYYKGGPGQWRTGVRNFQRLQYQNLYSGVDVVFYGNGRDLQFDFMLAPKSNVDEIVIA